MKKKKIFVLILNLIFINVYSQDISPSLKPIGSSPNSIALGTYGVIPISLYTGRFNLDIPIYEIDLDGKKIPISLSYQTSGAKPSQNASSVGLGWVLNAGGCITRSIRGLDDFDRGGQQALPFIFPGDNDPHSLFEPDWWGDRLICDRNILSCIDGELDPEADSYFYNFCNYSGEIMPSFDDEKSYYFNNYSNNLFVESSFSDGWVLFDSDGYKYVFNQVEISNNSYKTDRDIYVNPEKMLPSSVNQSVKNRISTAWYLTEIKSPKNNTIKFIYEKEEIQTPISFSESSFFKLLRKKQSWEISQYFSNDYKYYSYTCSRIIQPRIKKIEFAGGEVNFLNSNRLDISPVVGGRIPQKIDSIQVKNIKGEIINNISLSYSYLGNTDSPLTCRMMLDDVVVNSKKYTFSYNQGTLPSKQSLATDLWGYYNASQEPDRQSEFKSIPGRTSTYLGETLTLSGRNKEASFDGTLIGTLSSVKYPTGATSSIFYELNEYETTSLNYNDIIISNRQMCEVLLDKNITNEDLTVFYGKEQQVKTPANGTFMWVLESLDMVEENEDLTRTFSLSITIDKKEGDNWKFYKGLGSNIYTVGDLRACIHGESTSELLDGIFRVTIVHSLNNVSYKNVNVSVSYCYLEPAKSENESEILTIKGNGVRVKEVKNTHLDGKIESIIYQYADDEGRTSGLEQGSPLYSGIMKISKVFNLQGPDKEIELGRNTIETPYIFGQTSSISSLSNSAVGYSMVKTYYSGNGYTIHKYNNTPDLSEVDFNNVIPGIPSIIDPNNGSILEYLVYDSNNNLKESIIYNYEQKKNIYLQKGLALYDCPMRNLLDNKPANAYLYLFPKRAFYSRLFQKYALVEEKKTIYTDNKISVVELKEYNYDSNYVINTGYKIQSSKAENVESQIKYPFDYTNTLTDKMKSKKMLNYPLESVNLINNKVVNATKIDYKDTLDIIVPSRISSLNSSTSLDINNYKNSYSLENTITKYDSKGNILEVRNNKNQMSIIYLWSYNYQYPIAEIKNATYSDVETAVKSAFGVSSIEGLSQKLSITDAQLNNLRNHSSLKKAYVTTYTYKPLVGMLTATDPRGITTYYDYDSFGSLTEVYTYKDNIVSSANKQIIEQYSYNYKNK